MITESPVLHRSKPNEAYARLGENLEKILNISYALKNGLPRSGYQVKKGELFPLTFAQKERRRIERKRTLNSVRKDFSRMGEEKRNKIFDIAGVTEEQRAFLTNAPKKETRKRPSHFTRH